MLNNVKINREHTISITRQTDQASKCIIMNRQTQKSYPVGKDKRPWKRLPATNLQPFNLSMDTR